MQATGKPKGVLKCVEFLTAIERFFPSKSGSHLLALRTALQQDLENTFLGMAVTKKRKKAREADDNAASPGVSTSDGWMDVSVCRVPRKGGMKCGGEGTGDGDGGWATSLQSNPRESRSTLTLCHTIEGLWRGDDTCFSEAPRAGPHTGCTTDVALCRNNDVSGGHVDSLRAGIARTLWQWSRVQLVRVVRKSGAWAGGRAGLAHAGPHIKKNEKFRTCQPYPLGVIPGEHLMRRARRTRGAEM